MGVWDALDRISDTQAGRLQPAVGRSALGFSALSTEALLELSCFFSWSLLASPVTLLIAGLSEAQPYRKLMLAAVPCCVLSPRHLGEPHSFQIVLFHHGSMVYVILYAAALSVGLPD